MALHFNTLRYVESLQSTGITERQAKAKVEALAMVLDEWASGLLVTRDAIDRTKVEMTKIRSELKLVRWMLVVGLVGVVSLVMKAFF